MRSLIVVEALAEVIAWHERGLVSLGARLTSDSRCRLDQGDFFAMAGDPNGLDPGRRIPHTYRRHLRRVTGRFPFAGQPTP